MEIDRRKVIIGMAGLAPTLLIGCNQKNTPKAKEANMYGLISKITAVDGKRDELSAILLKGLHEMPGNLSYIVANDPTNTNTLWVTEIWADIAAHKKSLALPSVQHAIKIGRPLIAEMERITETQPIGGEGL